MSGLGDTTSYAGSTVGMLRAAGINDTQATMAASGMFWTVGGSNVHAPVTQVMVRAVQRMLNNLVTPGDRVFVDGLLSMPTRDLMQRFLGPNFGQMTWAGVMAVLRNKLDNKHGEFVLNQEPDLLPVSGLGDFKIAGIPAWLLALGAGAAYYAMKKRKGRR